MKRILLTISIILAILFAVPLITNAALTPVSWIRDTVAGFLRPGVLTDTLRIPSLTNCDTIDTDADGDFACGTDDGGGGGSIILDLADDGSNESAGITEIATSGDTNSIFSEPTANKLLINLGLDWPKADTADDLTCTDCIGATEISDVYVLNAGDTMTGTLNLDGGDLTIDNNGDARFFELDANGSNYKAFRAPASITTNTTCIFEDDASFIPDSCVGNGSDAVGSPGGSDGQLQFNDGGVFGGMPNFYTPNSGSSLNFVDNNFFIEDNADATKLVQINASGVTAGQTSILDAPDADGVIVLNANTATLTNKTIDSDSNTLSVDPDELKSVDSPADEECYTYESTGTTGEWQACGAGGATAYDDIGDPDANSTIAFNGFTNNWTSSLDGGDIFAIESSDADFTSDTTGLQIGFRDNGDANGIFLDFVDDLAGTPNSVFSVGADGIINSDSGATFASTVFTPTLDLTGTGTLNGLDAIDATTETTLEAALDIAGDVTGTGLGAVTIAANAVALTTDTTGNYVSSATASGGLTMTGTEGASLGVLLPSATDALSSTTSSGSGLELLSGGLTLLQGCSDGQILKWTEATDLWGCAADGGGGGSFDSTTVDATTWSDGANASNTWTFDVSGTDTTATFGNNNWIFGTGSVDLGSAGVRLSHDGDGAITFLGLGNGSDEDLTLNLDDTSNTGVFSSSTGLNLLSLSDINLNVESLSAGATGSNIDLYHNSASPAANDVMGTLNFFGKDSGGNKTTFGQIVSAPTSVTDTFETGKVSVFVQSSGSLLESARFTPTIIATNAFFSSIGNTDTVINTGNATTGSLTLSDGANGNLNFAPNGTGELQVNSDSVMYRCEWLGLDQYSNITTGTDKNSFVMPYAMTVKHVYASLTTGPTGSVATFDINESGTSILSTKLTIDASETSSQTAATAAVISDTALAKGNKVSFDIDGSGSTTPGNGIDIQVCGDINY